MTPCRTGMVHQTSFGRMHTSMNGRARGRYEAKASSNTIHVGH